MQRLGVNRETALGVCCRSLPPTTHHMYLPVSRCPVHVVPDAPEVVVDAQVGDAASPGLGAVAVAALGVVHASERGFDFP